MFFYAFDISSSYVFFVSTLSPRLQVVFSVLVLSHGFSAANESPHAPRGTGSHLTSNPREGCCQLSRL